MYEISKYIRLSLGQSIQSAENGAITKSGWLTTDRYGLKNAALEHFWDCMAGTQAL